MNKFIRKVVLSAVVMPFVVACAGSGINQGDFNVVSLEEEWELGQQLEKDLEGKLDLVDDPEVLAYINQVGNRLVRNTQMSNMPWKFHVVRNDEINAFNIPGGHVYVHTGLIEAAENASQLAGVMAHEVGHGVARAYGLNIVASLLLGSDPQVYQQVLAQILGTGAIARFSRDAEREADELAVRYMYQANYDPEGIVTFFEVLQRQGRGGSDPVSRFFATHPLTEERIRHTRALVDELPPRQGYVDDSAAFQDVRARVRSGN